ncbi:glycosyl transferase [Chimaeribacter arupi]|jgi:glucosyl-3-phosphoglycerate synthase|uniref:Glycosyl transferase n=4 Tax=Yersiniaceae TaxID=1903411 RepID=A0A2N5ER20_9GAMM|nr:MULTISPECIES: glycosyl transferase [Yersiniaceae]MDU6412546.1 glycosyl transferase [Yersiniaceae bacterium]MBS0970925.1 glycosyl transferase [Nissabacter archeti]MDV5139138.1 glycosyl transferase [Chimaeribacter arupi]PLR30310.1 glycosyl transferase [Chimaeribacter coloradensis]PLR35479.1 glycosyl transferase [Chimaeribacter californicus]
MSDFYQDGVITNFHNFSRRKLEELEYDLQVFSGRRSMGLILPSLFSELEGPALTHIVDELCKVNYLEEIVIGLDRADRDQFLFAREFFSRLPQRHRILWNDGPRLKALDEELAKEGLSPQEPGKGRNVWFCVGYTLASRRTTAVGLHDCDIVTYNREMLARMMYPIANPNFHYDFCKGYYARVANGKLNGRVGRLLVYPLLKSLERVYGRSDFLEYLRSYRYPLSGEFAMRTHVLNDLRIPSDWGLEIGVLSELHRTTSTKRICQVDIADNYDHKHQPMSEDDATAGLQRMSIDITKALYRKLAILGVPITSESFRVLRATYYRTALDMIDDFDHDARMNGLTFDRHSEESAVEMFSNAIMEAGAAFTDTPSEKPFIPSWSRIQSAFPDMLERIYDAVEKDNAGDV